MHAKRRSNENGESESPDLIQVLAVYHGDLMAEVEGLLRSLTRTQAQIERLRTGGDLGTLTESQRREAVKLLWGNLKTFAAKVETLRETLPEILSTAENLAHSEAGGAAES